MGIFCLVLHMRTLYYVKGTSLNRSIRTFV